MPTGRRTQGCTTHSRRSRISGQQLALPPPPACKPLELPPRTPKQKLQAADAQFRKDVVELRNRRRRLAGELLQYRYDIGRVAARIVDEAKKAAHERYYGSHTVPDLARAINEKSRTIYQCIKFVQQVSPERLEELKARECPWRAVSSIMTVEDDHARKEIEERVESGEFEKTDDLRKAVSTTNAEIRKNKGRTDNRAYVGGGQALSMINSFNRTFATAGARIGDLIKAVECYTQNKNIMSPATRDSLEARLREAKSHLRATERLLFQAEKVVADCEPMLPGARAGGGPQDMGQGEPVQQGQVP